MHENNGNCPGCEKIFNRYPHFYKPLKDWFKALQAKHHEAHISCAGRGRQEQEDAYARGASRAHWGESAHNYNAAIDIFEQSGDRKNIYERAWFASVIAPNLPDFLDWYGQAGVSGFRELPHVEVKYWSGLAQKKILKLVE